MNESKSDNEFQLEFEILSNVPAEYLKSFFGGEKPKTHTNKNEKGVCFPCNNKSISSAPKDSLPDNPNRLNTFCQPSKNEAADCMTMTACCITNKNVGNNNNSTRNNVYSRNCFD